MFRIVLMIVAILLVLGALPAWPHSAQWGYAPAGTFAVIAAILLVFVLLRRTPR